MKLVVNGQEREVSAITVRELVVALGLAQAAVAVEVNGRLVPRRQHEITSLNAEDRVEVVTLVGGG